ncbi:MAG: ketoacyl-ACP synthase III [Flavobacteriales bacterium]|nr:ketoacyl-ACP synthase III [Flavobacteriales bacterium]
MAVFKVENISIKGISACVPKQEESNWDYNALTDQEKKLLIKTTGVVKKRIADNKTTTSDLCYTAAQELLKKTHCKAEQIELLVFVSQSPDYFLPATSVILQNKLGLPKTTIAFDINLGCSGYVYGLSIISSLISTTKIKKALLLTGDVSSFSIDKKDKSTYPLFGDAGSATLIEYNESSSPIYFNAQSDGAGFESIIIPDGGIRNPLTAQSFNDFEVSKGIVRSKRSLTLNGENIFNFSLREVPPNVKELIDFAQFDIENVDFFIMHQANKLMNEAIRKKLGIPPEKVPYSLEKYGNTSSASIPLTIIDKLNQPLSKGKKHLILSGFGVGLSWASALIYTENLICTEVINYE